jgi:hypothetical protein
MKIKNHSLSNSYPSVQGISTQILGAAQGTSVPYQHITSTVISGHDVTWVHNPYFDNLQSIKEMPTVESVLVSLEQVLKDTPHTPEELTELQDKLDSIVRQARINQTAKIAITL